LKLVEPWNVVFLAGFVAYVAIRGRFARGTKDNVKTVRRVDAVEKILLVFVGISSLSEKSTGTTCAAPGASSRVGARGRGA
jgi:hypothetical protein